MQETEARTAVPFLGLDPSTGTLREAVAAGAPPPERWCMSVCPYCGVGCGVDVGAVGNRVVAVRGMKEHPVNKGVLCHLGHYLVDILDTNDRLRSPLRRNGSVFETVGWDDAIRSLADRIRATIDRHGPDSVAMYISASEYLEEYYIYNKFVKGCLGTNNLDSSARLCWASGVVGIAKAFGADSPPCTYEDIELSDLFVVSGYNPAASKPVLFQRMLRARSRNETSMIVIDPRRTNTATRSDLHLRIKPGTDVVLHNVIVNVLIEEELIDETEARSLTSNYDDLKSHVKAYTLPRAAAETGVSADEIIRAARMIGKAKAALFLWGQGLNQSRIGTRKVTTFLNLAFVTGNVGKPGAGPLAVTGQTSAMGLREVGALPHLLPGFRSVADAQAREEIERIWRIEAGTISPRTGKTIVEVIDGIEQGDIKLLWIIHSNPAATFPDSQWTRSILEKTEYLVVQDCYHPTETTLCADLVLPGAQWAEKGGTMTNSERGLNLVEQAVKPPGDARPDLEIVMDVARTMGFEDRFAFRNTEEIFDEYKKCVAGRACDLSGISYARLRTDRGIQWPVPTTKHPGTPRRFLDRRFPQGKLILHLQDHDDPAELPDRHYPLILITGVVPQQFHSRTRTAQVAKLDRLLQEPFVEIHPADAGDRCIRDRAVVRVVSRRGSVRAKAHVTDAVSEGTVFVPYHFGFLGGKDQAVNALTIRSFDESAGQPEYKACAVNVETI